MIIFSLPTAPLFAADSPTAIEGEYLVVFKNEVGDDVGKFVAVDCNVTELASCCFIALF